MKYVKKPIIVEAIQYKHNKIMEVMNWIEEIIGEHHRKILIYDENKNRYYIKTLEGDMYLSDNDYVICGIEKEFYPCKSEIFEKTYKKVD